jgi:hypothetical protein
MLMSVALAWRAGEERALALLDGARAALLARAGRVPGVAFYRRARSARLVAVAVASVGAAFVLAVAATWPLLALSPVLLGIPHVASDLRYLVARPAPGLRWPARAFAPLLALFALSLALGLGGAPRMAAAAGGLAVLWAGLATPSSRRARAVFAAVAAFAGAIAVVRPATAGLVMAQGHNLVAVALAGWLVRRQLTAGWLVGALVAAGAVAILGGACDGWLAAPSAASWAEVAWRQTVTAAAPAGLDPLVLRRWVALFAFAQAVHYSAWIHLVPDALRAAERPVSFRRSFQLLCEDLGPSAARAVVVLSLALPIAACFSLDGARMAYLGLSVFHAYVELAAVAVLVLGRFRR